MNPVSVVNFAKACGVSRQTIYTAIHGKNVIQREDSKIDMDNETNVQYKFDISKNEKKPGPERKPETEIQSELPLTLDDLKGIENLIDFNKLPKSAVDKYRSLEQARTLKFKYELERGKYIKRDIVDKILNQIWVIDGMQLKNLADTLPSDIGVIFDTDDPELLLKVNELLHLEFNRIVLQIQNKVEKFIQEDKNNYVD